MSKHLYTAVESQLTISPLKRCASAMPSALLPVAVGPTMATTRGRGISVRRVPERAPARPTRPMRGAGRSAASAWDESLSRVFVVEERHRHHQAVVRVLGRQWIDGCGCG